MRTTLLIDLKKVKIEVDPDIVLFTQDNKELFSQLLPPIAEETWNKIGSLEDYKGFWASLLDYLEWISDEDIDIPFVIKFTEEDYFFSSPIQRLYRQWKKI